MSWVIETAVAPRSVHAGHNEIIDRIGHDRVETSRRLVEEEISGSAAIARASATRFCMPPDNSRGRQIQNIDAQPDGGEFLGGQFTGGCAAEMAMADALDEREGDILPDRQAVEQRRALEQHADLAAQPFRGCARRAGHRFAIDRDGPGVGLHQAEDAFEQHGFARARAADHHQRFAGCDLQIEAVEHDLAAEAISTGRGSRFWAWGFCHRAKNSSVRK